MSAGLTVVDAEGVARVEPLEPGAGLELALRQGAAAAGLVGRLVERATAVSQRVFHPDADLPVGLPRWFNEPDVAGVVAGDAGAHKGVVPEIDQVQREGGVVAGVPKADRARSAVDLDCLWLVVRGGDQPGAEDFAPGGLECHQRRGCIGLPAVHAAHAEDLPGVGLTREATQIRRCRIRHRAHHQLGVVHPLRDPHADGQGGVGHDLTLPSRAGEHPPRHGHDPVVRGVIVAHHRQLHAPDVLDERGGTALVDPHQPLVGHHAGDELTDQKHDQPRVQPDHTQTLPGHLEPHRVGGQQVDDHESGDQRPAGKGKLPAPASGRPGRKKERSIQTSGLRKY